MTTSNHGGNEVDRATRRTRLLERGAAVEEVPTAPPAFAAAADSDSDSDSDAGAGAPRLDLTEVLDRLGRREINELWVEAGARLAGALLRQSLVDELVVYVAPKLLGPQARPLVEIPALGRLDEAPNFDVAETRQIGADVRLRLRSRQPPLWPERGG